MLLGMLLLPGVMMEGDLLWVSTAELVAPGNSDGVANAGQIPSLFCLSIYKIATILLYFWGDSWKELKL